jgi:hypothetical protein
VSEKTLKELALQQGGRFAAVKYAIADSIRALIVSFFSYLELRLKLLGLEAREAGLHLLIIGLLLFTTLT